MEILKDYKIYTFFNDKFAVQRPDNSFCENSVILYNIHTAFFRGKYSLNYRLIQEKLKSLSDFNSNVSFFENILDDNRICCIHYISNGAYHNYDDAARLERNFSNIRFLKYYYIHGKCYNDDYFYNSFEVLQYKRKQKIEQIYEST